MPACTRCVFRSPVPALARRTSSMAQRGVQHVSINTGARCTQLIDLSVTRRHTSERATGPAVRRRLPAALVDLLHSAPCSQTACIPVNLRLSSLKVRHSSAAAIISRLVGVAHARKPPAPDSVQCSTFTVHPSCTQRGSPSLSNNRNLPPRGNDGVQLDRGVTAWAGHSHSWRTAGQQGPAMEDCTSWAAPHALCLPG